MTGRDHSSVVIAASDYNKEKNYWLKKLSGELQKSCFPYDHANVVIPTALTAGSPGEDSRALETVGVRFTGDTFIRMIKISKDSDYVLHMILVGGVMALLSKYTGDNDILVVVPIYKQEREADFLNTLLPVRVQLEEQMTFKELLRQVRKTMLEANENQNYPMETLLFQLNLPSFEDEFPLFDVAILLENVHHKKYIRHARPNMIFSFLRTPDGIEGIVEYNALRYDRSTVERTANYFKRLMDKAIFNIELPLWKVDLLSHQEREQLLVEFNDTRRDYPAAKTIDELFREQAARKPQYIALTYDGEPITYRQLDKESGALAAHLRSTGIKTEEPVALMVESSYKVIVAVLGILKAGGAYLFINLEYPVERKKYILDDCNARRLLTNCNEPFDYAPRVMVIHLEDSRFGQYKAGEEQEDQVRDNVEGTTGAARKHSSDSLVYIMYTSGSTGTPKGVMVTHRNAVRLVKNTNFIELKKGDSILLTGALEFDASTFEIWGALLNGLALHLVNKDTILSHDRLKQAIKRSGVTTMWMTSPLFNQVLDADIEIFVGLKHLLVGGDVLSPAHINRVRKRFPGLTVINGYGPTENTTFSTTFRIDKEYKENIPIGKPIANSFAYILAKGYHLVPIGVVGELCVGGDGLSRGYLNNPELTAEKFDHDLWDYQDYQDLKEKEKQKINEKLLWGVQGGGFLEKSPPGRRRQKIYKTGDLARWLVDGNIEFLGRVDHQVKIRGYRIEPGEIENHLVQMEVVKEAVVMDRQKPDGEKYLCAYVVPAEGETDMPDTVELRKVLSSRLPDYMVPAYIVQLEEIPLTPNGKVDRRVLPGPKVSLIGADYAPPRNPVEEKFVEIWAEVLKIQKGNVGIDSDFFELGGHSLKATILISKIHKVFNVKVPLVQLFMTPTIRELAEYVKGLAEDIFLSLQVAEKRDYYQLSSAQKRLYILQQMKLDSVSYNIPLVMRLEGELSKERLEETFKTLIQRHESFRTAFELVKEEPVQRIREQAGFVIGYDDLCGRSSETENVVQHFIKPFDLSRAPLLQVGLIKIREQQHILMVDIHHIITDGTSMKLLQKEFIALYAGEELSALKFQYKDYARWQNSEQQRKAVKQQEEYWLKQFAGEIPVLDLPLDYPRPDLQSFEGGMMEFQLEAESFAALSHLAAENGATLYMMLLTLYTIFLSKLSTQEDIVVGTPIAGRRHDDLGHIIGMFVNTLAVRNYPQGEKTFRYFLNEVKENTLDAFDNQDYQFEQLVEQVIVNRDSSRNPLFDALLALPNMEAPLEEIPRASTANLRVRSYGNEIIATKFDIELNCREAGDTLDFVFLYCTKLFQPETIQRFISYFKGIISGVVNAPDQEIAKIEIISEKEKKQVLIDFNDTAAGPLPGKTLHELFAEQVERTTDNIAVVGSSQIKYRTSMTHMAYISYRQLHEKSNQLAGLLIEKGVQADTIVGIMMERSLEMIIGLLGILKAGGAYLPIDPEYPEERVNYILKDSKVKFLVKKSNIFRKIKSRPELFVLDFEHLNFEFISDFGFRISNLNASNLAYIIYTSGTTGNPKGVMIHHKSVINLVMGLNQRVYNFNGPKPVKVSLISPYVFDASVKQIFSALVLGHTLVIIPEEARPDAEKLLRFYKTNDIQVADGTPIHLGMILNYKTGLDRNFPVKKMVIGGEPLGTGLCKQLLETVNQHDFQLINVYGPTECCDVTTSYNVTAETVKRQQPIPIGNPLPNVRTYVLGNYGELQVVEVAGELYIGGDGLSRGYLNNPELTAERFRRAVISHWSLVISSPSKLYTNDRSPKLSTNDQCPMTNDRSNKLYKTGDLARWLWDGNIEFLGRMDQQVKIRGYRIELGEIENQLIKHHKIKEAVVTMGREASEQPGDGYLCAYIAARSTEHGAWSAAELREYLSQTLPDYMIPSYFIHIEKIPLTPSGKIDRKALPAPEIKPEEVYAAPRDRIEEKLVKIWAEVLGSEDGFLPMSPGELPLIGINDNFFQLGGHSLKATVMIAKIHRELQVKVPLAEVFKTPTVGGLAGYIKKASENKYASIEPVEKREYHAQSSAQKRLYILQQMDLESTAYNMPTIIPFSKKPDGGRLEKTFKKLINRHESLRTSFHMINKKPVQRIHDEVEFEIEGMKQQDTKKPGRSIDRHPESQEPHTKRYINTFIRPFDLSQAPLLRIRWAKIAGERYLFMADMHHIISDAVSTDILIKEFSTLYVYKDDLLPGLRLQYKDYAQWQNRLLESGGGREQKKYWLNQLKEKSPVMKLPIDDIIEIPGLEVELLVFSLGSEMCDKIHWFALETGATSYIILLAAFNVLLSKYMDQEDIVIGSPVFGRHHVDLLNIIGMFVNMLPMRNYPQRNKTFDLFLKEVKENAINAFENQDYPFEQLVWELDNRSNDQTRLEINVVFDLIIVDADNKSAEENPKKTGNTPEPLFKPDESPLSMTKFDLILGAAQRQNEIILNFEYNSLMFKKQTIERMAKHFKNILEDILANPQVKLSRINMMGVEEKNKLIKKVKKSSKTVHAPVEPGKPIRDQAVKVNIEFDI